MKKIALIALALGMIAPAALAHDLNPPTWRGDAGTTYTYWDSWISFVPGEFLGDEEYNPYGTPTATTDPAYCEVIGYAGATNVLHIEDWYDYEPLVLNIPNNPVANEYKEIVLQVTWHWDGGPGYTWSPLGELLPDTQLTVDLGGGWYYDYLHYRIEPNPDSETITLTNEWGDLYIDQIVIDTICAPEPATLGLLAVGALALTRRRR